MKKFNLLPTLLLSSLFLLLLFLLNFCTVSLQDDTSLSFVENSIISKITTLLLYQFEARSVDLSIPILLNNISPTIPYSLSSTQSATIHVCGTPSQFMDRIKLSYLEHVSGYLRDSTTHSIIGHWSPSEKCYQNIASTSTTSSSSTNGGGACIYPMGTYFTNCASNSLLTLLPTRNMFYHLSLISTLKSDLIQMILQEKKLFILAQDLETIIIWGRETGIDEQLFFYKIQAFKMELRSLQTIYNENVKRYRDALYQYVNQFDIYYNLNEISSVAFSKLKTYIINGRYKYLDSASTRPTSSCFEILKNDLIVVEGVSGKNFDLVASFCGSIEFLDRHNSIVNQLMDIIENRFNNGTNEQWVSQFILNEAVVSEEEFSFLNEFSPTISADPNSYFAVPNSKLELSFEFSSMTSPKQNETAILTFTPNSVQIPVVDPILRNTPTTVFHSDSELQVRVFDVMSLIIQSAGVWTGDSSLESDYKELLTNLLTTTTKSSSSRSIFNREVNAIMTSPLTTVASFSQRSTSTRSSSGYNCEKGKYGPSCKVCSVGTYSPGDGLLYVCNNGPINQVTYTKVGETSENCAFKCKDSKKYRIGNTCQPIPIGYYSKDSGGEELAPCSLKGNTFGFLDQTIQHENLIFISGGSHGLVSSCQTAMKHFLSIPSHYLSTVLDSGSFTISMKLKLVDFNQFNFALKNYNIGYSIISFLDWVFQMNIDPFQTSTSTKSIFMQFKKTNSSEIFLISTSYAYDTDWHLFTLQYDQPNKMLTLYRDGSVIASCYLSIFGNTNTPSSGLIIGGMVDFQSLNPTMYFPGMIANFKMYSGMIGNEQLVQQYFTQQVCTGSSSTGYGNGKCLTLSCPNSKMIQEPVSSQCTCPFGRFFNEETSKCQACPYESTTGSILPRTSLKDCQCLPDYMYSPKYGECVLARVSLSPPTATFHFENQLGSYKELEQSIISQKYYPVGELKISFEPIEMENDFLSNTTWSLNEVYIYNVKLIFNNTKVMWSYSMTESELIEFSYAGNMTGDFDLIMSTDCDSHRAGLQSKTSFHVRERDLKPLIKPKPSDSQFDSPFQVRLLQPYKTKPSIVILCYGREEMNMTCVEYDEKQVYVFGPPLYLKTFSYGPNFQRLPGPLISYYYERTYSKDQLTYIENLKTWNDKLAKKQETLKENEEKKKASVLYQVFNTFIEWFLEYPNYLWSPIVFSVLVVMYIVLLVVIRFCIARRINRKRREKIKQYLKEKKNMEEYLKNFLPPSLRENGFDDDDELEQDEEKNSDDSNSDGSSNEDDDDSEEYTDNSSEDGDSDDEEDDQESDQQDDSESDSESNVKLHRHHHHHQRQNDKRITMVEGHKKVVHQGSSSTHLHQPQQPPNRLLPTKPFSGTSNSSRFNQDSLETTTVDVQLQNIGAVRSRNSSSNIIPISNTTRRALPNIPPQSSSSTINSRHGNTTSEVNQLEQVRRPLPKPKKENQGPKYLLCGECGGIARFWCKKCSKYLCIQCNQKDNSQHENCKSKVMVCDYCMQPRSELREIHLKGNGGNHQLLKMYACKMCLEELYEERKVNRVGSVLKRCTKCIGEEISKSQPEKKMCDNCIYYN